jgi:hypothetical protein
MDLYGRPTHPCPDIRTPTPNETMAGARERSRTCRRDAHSGQDFEGITQGLRKGHGASKPIAEAVETYRSTWEL